MDDEDTVQLIDDENHSINELTDVTNGRSSRHRERTETWEQDYDYEVIADPDPDESAPKQRSVSHREKRQQKGGGRPRKGSSTWSGECGQCIQWHTCNQICAEILKTSHAGLATTSTETTCSDVECLLVCTRTRSIYTKWAAEFVQRQTYLCTNLTTQLVLLFACDLHLDLIFV